MTFEQWLRKTIHGGMLDFLERFCVAYLQRHENETPQSLYHFLGELININYINDVYDRLGWKK